MNKTLRTNNSNNRIVISLMILGLSILFMSGCQQINDAVNGNKATNTNTPTNSNASANTNANSNVTANSNANTSSVLPTNSATNTNTQASNTATAPKEEVPLTEEAKVFKNNLVGEWVDNLNNKHKFTENTYEININHSSEYQTGSYKVVNENTLELVRNNGAKWNATMKIEDNGNTLVWKQPNGEWKFKRVNPK